MHGFGITTWPDGRIYEGQYLININKDMLMIKNMDMVHLLGVMEENI